MRMRDEPLEASMVMLDRVFVLREKTNPHELRFTILHVILPLTHNNLRNIDVFRHILMVDISVLVKSNMGRREYYLCFKI
jgi:hypothetical protein